MGHAGGTKVRRTPCPQKPIRDESASLGIDLDETWVSSTVRGGSGCVSPGPSLIAGQQLEFAMAHLAFTKATEIQKSWDTDLHLDSPSSAQIWPKSLHVA